VRKFFTFFIAIFGISASIFVIQLLFFLGEGFFMASRYGPFPEVKSIQVGDKTYWYFEEGRYRYFYLTLLNCGKDNPNHKQAKRQYEDGIDEEWLKILPHFYSGKFRVRRYGVEEFISIWVQEGTEFFNAKFPELAEQDF
jgi:hypothetical protein